MGPGDALRTVPASCFLKVSVRLLLLPQCLIELTKESTQDWSSLYWKVSGTFSFSKADTHFYFLYRIPNDLSRSVHVISVFECVSVTLSHSCRGLCLSSFIPDIAELCLFSFPSVQLEISQFYLFSFKLSVLDFSFSQSFICFLFH